MMAARMLESVSMKTTFDEELKPGAGDLLVFIDDTGQETFAGNQGFYGLGGCAVLGAGYPHLKERWRAVRKAINDDPDVPLHGSELERNDDNFAVLSEFFLDPSFVRIAATTTKAVSLPPGMDPCVPVMGQLQKEIAFVASAVPCKSVWIIVESSQRADAGKRQSWRLGSSNTAGKGQAFDWISELALRHERGVRRSDFRIQPEFEGPPRGGLSLWGASVACAQPLRARAHRALCFGAVRVPSRAPSAFAIDVRWKNSTSGIGGLYWGWQGPQSLSRQFNSSPPF
jgi:hypothetical protein